MTELTQQRKEQPGEILETLTELQEFITRLARSALLAGEHCPESDTDAFYSEACKAMNNLAWVIDEFQEGRSSLESENAELKEKSGDWKSAYLAAVATGEEVQKELDAAESENARLLELLAGKDELLVAYRLGDHKRADKALAKIEKARGAIRGGTNP